MILLGLATGEFRTTSESGRAVADLANLCKVGSRPGKCSIKRSPRGTGQTKFGKKVSAPETSRTISPWITPILLPLNLHIFTCVSLLDFRIIYADKSSPPHTFMIPRTPRPPSVLMTTPVIGAAFSREARRT